MRTVKFFLATVLCSMLCGCVGTEPNDEAYVVALGIDSANNGNYMVTIQFARPTQISGGASEEGGKGSDIVENLVVEAPNIFSAISLGNHTVSKELVLSHANVVVISSEVAESGIGDIIESLSRNEKIRPDIYLTVSRGSARDYLYSVRPVVEVNPTKYYQLIFEQNDSIGVPKMTLTDFCFNRANNIANVMPISGVIDSGSEESVDRYTGLGDIDILNLKSNVEPSASDIENSSSEGKNPQEYENENQKGAPMINSNFEFGLRNYIAGQLAINESNKSETVGMVIFKDNTAKTVGGAVVSEVYKLLKGEFHHAYVTIRANAKKSVTMDITQEKKPRIKVDIKNKTVTVNLKLEGDLYSLPSDFDDEADVDKLELSAKQDIEKACNKFVRDVVVDEGVDVLGVVEHSKSEFLTNDEFMASRDSVLKYPITVNCDFHIRRTGLTIK